MIAELICKQSLTRYTASSRIKNAITYKLLFRRKSTFSES